MTAIAPSLLNILTASLKEWESTTQGHQPVFIFDNLLDIIIGDDYLSTPLLKVWVYLMRQSRRFKRIVLYLSHTQMIKDLCISESGLRGHLNALETLGFLEKKTDYTRFGKEHTLRPSAPKAILSLLKHTLNNCRAKAVAPAPQLAVPELEKAIPSQAPFSAPEGCKKSSIPLQDLATLTRSNNNKGNLTLTLEPIKEKQETVHVSWEGKPLDNTKAYLSEPATPALPYQPRQGRAQGWAPTAQEFHDTVGPQATPPKNRAQQQLLIDVADWAIQAKVTFDRTAHTQEGNGQGFGQYLMRNRHKLDEAFRQYLQALLPESLKNQVPVLLQRMQDFQKSEGNSWFPETLCHLEAARKQFEEKKKVKFEPKLSPEVALSLPTQWFQRIAQTAKRLKLSQEHVLNLGYHVKHYNTSRQFSDEDELWKYRLCIAIKLIKDGRWSCPSGLASQVTRYQEGVHAC